MWELDHVNEVELTKQCPTLLRVSGIDILKVFITSSFSFFSTPSVQNGVGCLLRAGRT